MVNFFKINELANHCKRQWNLNENDPIDIFSVVPDKIKNLTIVFLKMKDNFSGACYKSSNVSIIFINSIHSKGRQSFTLAHEIYHLKYGDKDFSICGNNSDNEIEREADQFASCFLMSHGAFESYKLNNNIEKWDLDNIIKGEQFFQISHHAMLRRIRYLNQITSDEYNDFKPNIKSNALKRGYNLSLYEPYLNKDYFTIGNIVPLTELAFDNDLISIGKKEEILLDAFCGDLVFNFTEDDNIE